MSTPRKVTLKIDETVYPVTIEAEGLRAHVAIDCPGCKKKGPTYVGGKGMRRAHDYYQSDAYTMCCLTPLGTMRAYMSTLFGLEEDERVTAGRCRVY